MNDSKKIGDMNGTWALLLRGALATYPIVLAWTVWITVQTFENKAFRERGDRFTTTDAEIMRRQIDLRFAELPPAEWKARIIKIEDNQSEIMQSLAVIREKLDVIAKSSK